MRFREIVTSLMENKQQWVITNLGQKLQKTAEEEKRQGLYQGETDPTTITNTLSTFDPERGKNLPWIARLYNAKQFRLHDQEQILNLIRDFIRYKPRLQIKDLNSYSTLDQLYTAIEPLQDDDPDLLLTKGDKERMISSEELNIDRRPFEATRQFYSPGKFAIIIPKTLESSQFYAKDTKWCTRFPENFKSYSSQGPLYIIMANIGGKLARYQFHPETDEWKTSNNSDISDRDITALSTFPEYTQFLNMLIKKYYGKYFDEANT